MPGQRIDVAELCERYAISPTPMRNVLNRLVGEGIVEAHSHDGFYIPRLTETSLRDLLSWNEQLLLLAIDTIDSATPPPPLPERTPDIVAETEILFEGVAKLNSNGELTQAVRDVNDRMRAFRRLPDAGIVDSENELSAFRQEWTNGNLAGIRDWVAQYHSARQSALKQLIGLAYTAPLVDRERGPSGRS